MHSGRGSKSTTAESGRIESDTIASSWASTVRILAYAAIAIAAIPIFATISKGAPGMVLLIVAFFYGAMLFLLYRLIAAVLRRRKFGKSVFQMASVPGVIGGKLSGIVYTSRNLQPADGFHLTLKCVRKTTEYSEKKGKKTKYKTLWEESRTVAREMMAADAQRSAIPVLFAIPFESRETEPEAASRVLWRLEMRAALPGLDYHETFEVPVFKTPESNPNYILDVRPLQPYMASDDALSQAARAGVRIHSIPGGTEFLFPTSRSISMKVSLTAIVAFITLFFAVLVGNFDAVTSHLDSDTGGIESLASWIFSYFGGNMRFAFGIILLIMWLIVGYVWTVWKSLRIEGPLSRITTHCLGFSLRSSGAINDISDVQTCVTGSSNDKRYYGVCLTTRGGNEIDLVSNIEDKSIAEAISIAVKDALVRATVTTQG